MNEVEEYILEFNGRKKEIMLFFHSMLVSNYHLSAKLSFKIPFYYRNSWVVYLNPDKREGVEVAFTNGFKLDSKFTFLESKGRKMVKSVEFNTLEEIPLKEMEAVIEAAIALDHPKKS